MSAADVAPYEALLELIERQLQLAGEGRFDELAKVAAAHAALVETLPETPPPAAREVLQRAGLMQQRLTIELTRGREEVVHALGELDRARRTVNGYAPSRRRTPRLIASA